MTRIDQLQTDSLNLSQQSLDICQFIEKGQANTPLGELFQQLVQDSKTDPLGITLLCLTENARSAALKWLYGHNFAVFSLQVSRQIGLLEVSLKERGYSLEKSTGERLEFESWDSFIKGISDAALFQGEMINELKVATQAPTGVRNLQVLMPESTAFIAESPALLTRLLRKSNVLMVAAPPDYQLSSTDRTVLANLREDMCALWPLLAVDELNSEVHIPDRGWWAGQTSLVTLPPTLLTTHVDTAIPSYLSEARDQLRQALQLSLLAKRQNLAVDALNDRYETELRQLQSRKKREQRKSEQTGPVSSASDSVVWSQMRSEMSDDCAQLTKHLQELQRKRELPNSTDSNLLKSQIDALAYEDLDREHGYKVIKLSLGEKYLGRLVQTLHQQQQLSLKQDLKQVQQQLQNLAARIEEKCQNQLGFKPVLGLLSISENQLWNDIKEISGLELRYQGELPKRGFIDRLSEGRKGAMMLLMSVMLLGYVGIDLRNSGWMGLLILPIFFGAVIYTFISFKQDERHRLDKELTRVRDEVTTHSRRLMNDVYRLKNNKLMDYIEANKKQWLMQIDQYGREHQQRTQAESSQIAQRAKTRISAIDNQLKEWQNYRSSVQRLVSGAQSLLEKTRQALIDCVRS